MRTCLILTLAILASCSKPLPTVHVQTEPPAAAIWVNDELIGRAPVDLAAPPLNEALAIRAVLPGYTVWQTRLEHGTWPAAGSLQIVLDPVPLLTLQVRSQPPGATVFVDGEERGNTPFELDQLAPGVYQVVFQLDSYNTATRDVELPESTELDVRLQSPAVEMYMKRIKLHPDHIHNYIDLAHELMIERDFVQATAVLGEAMGQAVHDPDRAERFWQEIGKISDVQYNFGSEEDLATVNQALRNQFEVYRNNDPNATPVFYEKYAWVVWKSKDKDAARAIILEGIAIHGFGALAGVAGKMNVADPDLAPKPEPAP
jgi:hypothetical protein